MRDDDELTEADLAGRTPTCARCNDNFVVRGLDRPLRARLRDLMDSGQPITAIRLIRERAGCGLRDAKRIYEHLVILTGKCHECGADISMSDFLDCPKCSELNINVDVP